MASKKSQPTKPNYQGSLADYKASVKKSGVSIPGPIISAPSVYGALEQVKKTGKQVAKDTAIDLATMAAGGVLGKIGGKILGTAAAKISGKAAFETIAPKTISAGGKVSKTNTPFGPTLRSTKIMTQGQTAAAAKGLTKIASNRADEIGSRVAREVAYGSRTAAKGLSTLAIAANDTKVTKNKARKNKQKER